MSALLAPIFLYDSKTPFPGLAALIPCLGTVLLIYAHRDGFADTAVGRWLAQPFMTGIGKISYSLYLWHWPFLVLPRYALVEPLSAPLRLLAVAVAGAFLLAWFSWRFIENPVRERRFFKSGRVLFSAALCLIVLFTVTGRLIRHDIGWAARQNPLIQTYAREAADSYDFSPPTPYYMAANGSRIKTWPLGQADVRQPSFLALGDSHAGMWRPALRRLAEEYGLAGQAVDIEGCWPLRSPDDTGGGQHCPAWRRALVEMIQEQGITDVLVSVRYIRRLVPTVLPASPPDFSAGEQAPQLAAIGQTAEHLARLAADLNLAGARLWFVENVPEYPFHVTNMLSREALAHRPVADLGYSVALYRNRMAETRKAFEALSGPGLRILRVEESICPNSVCLPADESNTYYSDSNHLSRYGAMTFRSVLAPMFEAIRNNQL